MLIGKDSRVSHLYQMKRQAEPQSNKKQFWRGRQRESRFSWWNLPFSMLKYEWTWKTLLAGMSSKVLLNCTWHTRRVSGRRTFVMAKAWWGVQAPKRQKGDKQLCHWQACVKEETIMGKQFDITANKGGYFWLLCSAQQQSMREKKKSETIAFANFWKSTVGLHYR